MIYGRLSYKLNQPQQKRGNEKKIEDLNLDEIRSYLCPLKGHDPMACLNCAQVKSCRPGQRVWALLDQETKPKQETKAAQTLSSAAESAKATKAPAETPYAVQRSQKVQEKLRAALAHDDPAQWLLDNGLSASRHSANMFLCNSKKKYPDIAKEFDHKAGSKSERKTQAKTKKNAETYEFEFDGISHSISSHEFMMLLRDSQDIRKSLSKCYSISEEQAEYLLNCLQRIYTLEIYTVSMEHKVSAEWYGKVFRVSASVARNRVRVHKERFGDRRAQDIVAEAPGSSPHEAVGAASLVSAPVIPVEDEDEEISVSDFLSEVGFGEGSLSSDSALENTNAASATEAQIKAEAETASTDDTEDPGAGVEGLITSMDAVLDNTDAEKGKQEEVRPAEEVNKPMATHPQAGQTGLNASLAAKYSELEDQKSQLTQQIEELRKKILRCEEQQEALKTVYALYNPDRNPDDVALVLEWQK